MMCSGKYLPEGLVEGCRLRRDVGQDQVLTYEDVELPAGRVADRLRASSTATWAARSARRTSTATV